ncbi:T7SS effector LXG polymorphic toxin [Metabacillus iocasae]|uniref:Ribonuclease toxin of YeeF-YezG toxin-antitoxin module n=1 Tax=Priestia iocasae TaxID=2291674 RepID=A0ABS2QS56_9BACI|nr:T7SS effector LXG polymorphic toxin [Metabacillus iocasae]MBM7702298.1 putative ribonuclease toxin of YeeF-YezG toxin-antitoxin module [Metabacillus iocasae]
MEKVYESSTLLDAAKERVKSYEALEKQLQPLKQALQGMADLGDDFQGKGADNIKAFYRRHVDVVTLLEDMVGSYKHFFQNLDEQADRVKLSGNTIVKVPFVEQDVSNSLQRSKDMIAQQKEALAAILGSISDLVPLSPFSKEAFNDHIDRAEKKRRETIEAVEQLDANWVAEYTGLEPLFTVLQAHVQSLLQESSQGGTIYQMAFDEQAYKASELYSVQKALHEQSLQYVDYKKQEKDVYELEKQAEIEANKPWYEKTWDTVTTFTGEITGYYDYKRATEGIDPITGAKLSTSQRTTAGAMAAAGFIPIIGWAGRAFKGGKAIYSTAKGVNAANHVLGAYKTTQGFNILGKAEKGLYGLVLTNGLYEYTTGKDMFGNTISDEQRQASLFQSLGIAGAGALSSRYARQVGEAGAKAVAKDSQKLSDMRNVLSTYTVQRVMKPLQQSAQGTYRGAAEYVKKSFNKLGDTPVPVRVRVFQTAGNSQMGFGFETVTLKDGIRYIEKSVGKGTGKNQEVVKFTKEQLSTKPPYSRDPDKWQKKGGKIEIDEEGTWTYTDWEIPPNRVSYPGGFPDFKSAGMVKQEVPIGKFERYDLDFAKADELALNGPKSDENTWHHHQDLTTMQEIDKEMHRRFRHMGGMSLSKK